MGLTKDDIREVDERISSAKEATSGLLHRAMIEAKEGDKFRKTIVELDGEESRMTLAIARILAETMDLWTNKKSLKARKKMLGKGSELEAEARNVLFLAIAHQLALEFSKPVEVTKEEDGEPQEAWYQMMVDEFDSSFAKAMKSPRFQKVWKQYKEDKK